MELQMLFSYFFNAVNMGIESGVPRGGTTSSSRFVSRTLFGLYVGITRLSGWSPEGKHCGPKQAKQMVSCLRSMRTLCCHWVSKRQRRGIGQWTDGSSMVLFQIKPRIHAGFILFLQQSTIVSTPSHPGGLRPAARLWCTGSANGQVI